LVLVNQCGGFVTNTQQLRISSHNLRRDRNLWNLRDAFQTRLGNNDPTADDGFPCVDGELSTNTTIAKTAATNSDTDSESHQQALIQSSDAPSVMEIIRFALPAIGIYLCSPLLSTIDTSTVGLLCGTLQQAALNPAVTITDYSARTMSFLYTGTTNSIAMSKDQKSPNQVKEMFLGSLRLSALVGSGLGLFLLLSSQQMIGPLVGNEAVEVEVLRAAWRYVAIRALGMPAAAMIGTSQAACLGLQDNQTPFRIIIVAAFLNLVLDVAFVGRKAVWLGGTAGAAWATTISQYFALYLFLRHFSGQKGNIKRSFRNKLQEEPDTLSTRGFLAKRLSWKGFAKLPSRDTVNDYKPFVVPVTTTQIGRCSTYVAMGHVVSSTMNTVSMAAQQIITSIFYTLIPIGDSCSLTAQTFLPAILSREPSQKRSDALKKTIRNLFKVASMLGLLLSVVAVSLPLLCPLLTQDPAVIATVKQIVPVMLGLLSTHGIFCASEGILLGFRDLKFLGNIYAAFFVAVPALMLRLKYAARAGANVSLRSIWELFLGYQAFRISSFLSRVVVLRRRQLSSKSGSKRKEN